MCVLDPVIKISFACSFPLGSDKAKRMNIFDDGKIYLSITMIPSEIAACFIMPKNKCQKKELL